MFAQEEISSSQIDSQIYSFEWNFVENFHKHGNSHFRRTK